MKSISLLTAFSTLIIFCKLANAEPIKTVDRSDVHVPKLRMLLNIPECNTDGNTNYEECRPADEPALFDEITKISFEFQTSQSRADETVSQRDFHALHHACLAGVWTPLTDIPSDVAIGVFAQKQQVKAVVRYSNGSPKKDGQVPPDSKPDGRGLAIKLVGVEGESILDVEDSVPGYANQDFVLINNPAFFLRSPKSYPVFLNSLTKGETLPNGLPSFLAKMDPLERSVIAKTNTVVPDVVAARFFSQTPYVLGPGYAKYSVRPCNVNEVVAPLTETELQEPHFLRERIRARLEQQPICLIFSVQRKTALMQVEDAAIEWKEDDSKFVDVARIDIPSNQDINDKVRDSYCENISFHPWNSLPENRPAGAINRARLEVYSAISRKRRMENKVPIREPKTSDAFFQVLSP